MRNAKLWSVLLAAMLLCACVLGVLFTGASASDSRIPTATTTYEVGTDGATIRACLDKAAGETWVAGSVLKIQSVAILFSRRLPSSARIILSFPS